VRRPHHDAFHDSLTADERFFAALQHGEHLNARPHPELFRKRQG
jgi:hypothetical protein